MKFDTLLALYALAFSVHLSPAAAIWPFKQKRYAAEAFIDAGGLGLEGVEGRVVAVGDWDGDQNSDLFTLSKDSKTVQLYLWNRAQYRYFPSHSLTLTTPISNLVPGDFNHDGRLDLLVMYEDDSEETWWGGKGDSKLGMKVYLGGGADGGFQADTWNVPSSSNSQPLVFDADGSLRPSLLGVDPSVSEEGQMRVWRNNGTGLNLHNPPLRIGQQICSLADPHSSAFVDIDGDCLPDLVLHCGSSSTTRRSIQIWLNRGEAGYVYSKAYDLPRGSGQLSFADMNRDGNLDIIFPVCARQSTNTGVGTDCSINIAYNKQIPICSTQQSHIGKDGQISCRGWGELCSADPDFSFDFDPSSDSFTSIPLATLFPSSSSPPGLLLHVPHAPSIPLPLRIGDYDLDGYPDLLVVIHNSTAAPPNGIFGGGNSPGTQVKILQNSPCSSEHGVRGCEKGQRRGLKAGGGKGWDALDDVWDATGASWLDVDDDGSLDILVQRTGEQTEQKISIIQNNFYHDAFFLKALVLNGACDGECVPTNGGKKYSPLGVSYSGASYKFTVLDTLGRRVATQVAQLPQTSYHSLGTPYAFIGLGRTNNYVENLFVGTSLHPPDHTTTLESLIPNSQLLITPPSSRLTDPPPDEDDQSNQPVKTRSKAWRSELFLQPGDWVPWVGAAVIGTVLFLWAVVIALGAKEKSEDERERRRALHGINFQAL